MDEQQTDETPDAADEQTVPDVTYRVTDLVPTQAEYDQELLKQNLQAMRGQIAQGKLNCLANMAGIPGVAGHYRQHATELERCEKVLAFFEDLAAQANGGEIPRPVGSLLLVMPGEDVGAFEGEDA